MSEEDLLKQMAELQAKNLELQAALKKVREEKAASGEGDLPPADPDPPDPAVDRDPSIISPRKRLVARAMVLASPIVTSVGSSLDVFWLHREGHTVFDWRAADSYVVQKENERSFLFLVVKGTEATVADLLSSAQVQYSKYGVDISNDVVKYLGTPILNLNCVLTDYTAKYATFVLQGEGNQEWPYHSGQPWDCADCKYGVLRPEYLEKHLRNNGHEQIAVEQGSEESKRKWGSSHKENWAKPREFRLARGRKPKIEREIVPCISKNPAVDSEGEHEIGLEKPSRSAKGTRKVRHRLNSSDEGSDPADLESDTRPVGDRELPPQKRPKSASRPTVVRRSTRQPKPVLRTDILEQAQLSDLESSVDDSDMDAHYSQEKQLLDASSSEQEIALEEPGHSGKGKRKGVHRPIWKDEFLDHGDSESDTRPGRKSTGVGSRDLPPSDTEEDDPPELHEKRHARKFGKYGESEGYTYLEDSVLVNLWKIEDEPQMGRRQAMVHYGAQVVRGTPSWYVKFKPDQEDLLFERDMSRHIVMKQRLNHKWANLPFEVTESLLKGDMDAPALQGTGGRFKSRTVGIYTEAARRLIKAKRACCFSSPNQLQRTTWRWRNPTVIAPLVHWDFLHCLRFRDSVEFVDADDPLGIRLRPKGCWDWNSPQRRLKLCLGKF